MWAARRETGCNSSSSYAKFADTEGCLNQWVKQRPAAEATVPEASLPGWACACNIFREHLSLVGISTILVGEL